MAATTCEEWLDPCDALEIRKPTARKMYQCAECYSTITPGTKYVRLWYVFEGEMGITIRCIPCQQIAEDYCCGIVSAGVAYDMVRMILGTDLRTGEIVGGL